MKQLICKFKNNKLLKLYFIVLSAINIIYVYFEVSKFHYIQTHSLEGTIEGHQFQYLIQISKVTSFFQYLIIFIYLAYLIKVLIKKDKLNIKQFLVINFMFMIIITIINYLAAFVFLAPVGNLTQQWFIPADITFKVFTLVIVMEIFQRMRKTFGKTES